MTTTTVDAAASASIQAAARELKLPVVRTDAARVAGDAERSKLTYLRRLQRRREQGACVEALIASCRCLSFIEWFNHRRLHGELDHTPPAEHEADHYARHRRHATDQTPTLT